MNSLCRKDVLRNHYFIPVVFLINLMYIGIYFVPGKIFYELHTGTQAAYVLSIALMIPFLVYMRYGDDNVNIIENVIRPTIMDIHSYYIYYWFWMLFIILGFAAAAAVAIMFSDNCNLYRSSLFVADIFVLCATLMQLFVVLHKLIKKFVYVFIIYILCLLGLIFINAPDSYLWFVYDTEIENLMLNHWIGKGILLFVVTVLNIGQIQFNKYKYKEF